MKKILISLLFLWFYSTIVSAQPCMDKWRFRTPITIDNTANPNPLVDYQFKIELATNALIAQGEMKADGGDIRITNSAGVELPFWIENYTINTATTVIWINVDNIPPLSTIDLYMFYGNVAANSVASGDATFLLYDNFDGTALDFGKWSFCGGGSGGTIPVVSNGEVTFASSSGLYSHSITSVAEFSDVITTELKVNSFNFGTAAIGHINNSKDGYAMALEEDGSGVDNMRLVSVDAVGGGSDMCLTMVNQTPVNSVASGGVQGLWSFTWSQANESLFSWPNGSETRISTIDNASFIDNKRLFLGSFTNTGSVSVDYIYTRKYSAIVPIYSYASRTDLIDIVEASTNAPICRGKTLRLYATDFTSGIYNWVGPNGFTSTDQNPVINVSDFTHIGDYVVTVSSSTSACDAVSAKVSITLDAAPVAGTLSNDTTVCLGLGEGELELSGKTGDVIYWESANTINGPWNTISDTNTTLAYSNLINTQYYRTLVKSGTCGVDTSNIVTVSIDPLSNGGNIAGGNVDACYGFNSGLLRAINYTGEIIKWQNSSDFGTNWTDMATNASEIKYSNLTDTTWYRMLVKNGVCDSAFSDTAVVFVQPIPVVDFIADSVCFNNYNSFSNKTTIASGNISQYEWNFNDGNSANIENPTHAFTSFGKHKVFLKAISYKGCIDSITKDVIVYPNPVAKFSFSDVCDTSLANFTNLSTIATDTITHHIWTYSPELIADTAINGNYKYATHGNYDVELKNVSQFGCTDSLTKTIRILQRAKVSFIADSVCLNEYIVFENTSETNNDSTMYSWSFGDGNFSNLKNPNYKYDTHGTYKVVLQANTFGKCVNMVIDTVVIHPLPHANFSFTNDCQYDTIQFKNNTTIASGLFKSFWNFGDSVTSQLDSVGHKYSVPGNYFVNLKTVSEYGCNDDTTLMTEIYPIPIANFVVSNVCRDTLTPITNTSTINSGSMSYQWSFGNNAQSNAIHPNYVYPVDSSYNIQLIAISNYNCFDTVEHIVTIHPIPKTNFVAPPVCMGETTNFENTTSINKGYISSYLWNYNDQSFSIDKQGTHTYAMDGTYNVSLRAVSDKGCLKDTVIDVVVNPTPETSFSFENACIYAPVQFYNESLINTGSQTYSWQFGDNETSIEESPNHIYEQYGIFPVQLTALSDKGCSKEITQFIEIYPLPLVDAGLDTVVSFGYSTPLMGIAPSAAQISWSPGEFVENPKSLLTNATPLTDTIFTLKVTDEFGCTDFDEVQVRIENDYKLLVTNVVTPNGDGKNDTWKIFNADSFDDIHVRIYDRWGYEVYSANNYHAGWDGVLDLEDLPEATYYYIITFDSSDKIYKGAITILR